MSELSREQVELLFQQIWDLNDQASGEALLDHDAALRQALTQQAQEVELATEAYTIAYQGKEDLRSQLAAVTTERDEWKDQWRKTNDEFVRTAIKLSQQNGELSALQARCRELEGYLHMFKTPEESMLDMATKLAHLQATLAAREARILELERGLATVVQLVHALKGDA